MPSWALVLHFYQPPTQSLGLTEEILRTCYLPLVDLLLNSKKARVTINLSASLLLQTQTIPNHDFATKIEELYRIGKAEFLNSPIYHPITPLTPPEVIERQLLENEAVLGSLTKIKVGRGVFPPELAIDKKSLELYSHNADYILVDESSINPHFDLNKLPSNPILKSEFSTPTGREANLNLVVASRSVSELIRSYPTELHAQPLTKFINSRMTSDQSLVTMSDAELFGHHYRERINFLKELFDQNQFEFINLSEAIHQSTRLPVYQSPKIVPSSWQTSTKDLAAGNPFPLWKTPANKLQENYYQLAQIAYFQLSQANPTKIEGHVLHSAQAHFDQGTSSCHTYWLSQIPWWHPDLVEKGAQQLIKCIRTLPIPTDQKREAETFYHQFLMDLWHHHWSGQVEQAYLNYDCQRPTLLKGLPSL